jgi:hypothetical protein
VVGTITIVNRNILGYLFITIAIDIRSCNRRGIIGISYKTIAIFETFSDENNFSHLIALA